MFASSIDGSDVRKSNHLRASPLPRSAAFRKHSAARGMSRSTPLAQNSWTPRSRELCHILSLEVSNRSTARLMRSFAFFSPTHDLAFRTSSFARIHMAARCPSATPRSALSLSSTALSLRKASHISRMFILQSVSAASVMIVMSSVSVSKCPWSSSKSARDLLQGLQNLLQILSISWRSSKSSSGSPVRSSADALMHPRSLAFDSHPLAPSSSPVSDSLCDIQHAARMLRSARRSMSFRSSSDPFSRYLSRSHRNSLSSDPFSPVGTFTVSIFASMHSMKRSCALTILKLFFIFSILCEY